MVKPNVSVGDTVFIFYEDETSQDNIESVSLYCLLEDVTVSVSVNGNVLLRREVFIFFKNNVNVKIVT